MLGLATTRLLLFQVATHLSWKTKAEQAKDGVQVRTEFSWNAALAALNSVDDTNKSQPLFRLGTSDRVENAERFFFSISQI